jgi:hypothetical protein
MSYLFAAIFAAQILAEEAQFRNSIMRANLKGHNLVQQVSSAKFDGTAHGGRIVLERPTGWKQVLNAII